MTEPKKRPWESMRTFEQFIGQLTDEQLGSLVRQHTVDSNHNGWDAWTPRTMTGVQALYEDLMANWNLTLVNKGGCKPEHQTIKDGRPYCNNCHSFQDAEDSTHKY